MVSAVLIRRLIDEAQHADDWTREYACQSGCLPVWCDSGRGDALVITLTGDVLRVLGTGQVVAAADHERLFALAHAARSHSGLAHLCPARPPDAVTCRRCDGLGALPQAPGGDPQRTDYCDECSSLGWITPHPCTG